MFSVLLVPFIAQTDSIESEFEEFAYFSQTPTLPEGTFFPTKTQITKNHRIALFDTQRNCRYVYQPFIDLAKTLNITVDYYSVGNILDSNLKRFPVAIYDGAFFILCTEFLKTIRSSPASKKILSLMKDYSKLQDKVIGLMLPPLNPRQPNALLSISPILEKAGIQVQRSTITFKDHKASNPRACSFFFNASNQFLKFPAERRSISYHTALKLPQQNSMLPFRQKFETTHAPFAVLPIKQNYPSEIKGTFPHGMYIYNPKHKNHIVLSSSSLLSFAGISENFQLYPLNVSIRTGLQDAFHETLWELSLLFKTKKDVKPGIPVKQILNETKPTLPLSAKKLQAFSETLGRHETQNEKTAWMEIKIFEEDNQKPEVKKQQKQLISFILDSKLDSLWLSISPNIYYSPIAGEQSRKEIFLSSLSKFTKQLQKSARAQNVAPPTILIGFEIANNLSPKHMTENVAYDLYGNKYEDVPQPLDKSFWNNEVKKSLSAFLDDWKNKNVSHGIKIEGVVLDLEMYGRKTTAAFLPTMGFEKTTAEHFPFIPKDVAQDSKKLSKYLIDNKLTKQYFHVLEAEAKKLGNELRIFINDKIPNATVGCYAPNISTDWFYKGIYKGLSKPEKPIYLLTFNAEFYAHKKWLESHSIQAKHASVLMLSKIRNKNDFSWVDYVLQRHDGIWFNRFSRMAEPYHKDWSTLEQTSLPMKDRQIFAEYISSR